MRTALTRPLRGAGTRFVRIVCDNAAFVYRCAGDASA